MCIRDRRCPCREAGASIPRVAVGGREGQPARQQQVGELPAVVVLGLREARGPDRSALLLADPAVGIG
eukprot:14473130-Alexandrium_andersonii.AAC.1